MRDPSAQAEGQVLALLASGSTGCLRFQEPPRPPDYLFKLNSFRCLFWSPEFSRVEKSCLDPSLKGVSPLLARLLEYTSGHGQKPRSKTPPLEGGLFGLSERSKVQGEGGGLESDLSITATGVTQVAWTRNLRITCCSQFDSNT